MSSKYIDITGNRFGRLVAIERVGMRKHDSVWMCKCDCGNTAYVIIGSLRSGNTRSCGCIIHENKSLYRHGLTGTRIYRIWANIKSRCTNPNVPCYKYYGGRGITICDEWLHSPENFATWANSNGYNDELTIERIDYNGNYCPENCKWIPWKEQSNNTRSNIWCEIDGITKNVKQWCNELKLPYSTIMGRIHRGMDVKEALLTPVINHNK